MKKILLCIVASATMLFTNSVSSQENKNYSKISLSYIQATTDLNIKYRTSGLEIEYYKNLHKRYGISFNFETSFFNNIPKLLPESSEKTVNSNNIANYTQYLVEKSSISQSIISGHFYLNLLNSNKNFLYISNGVGLNIQRIGYFYYLQYSFTMNNGELIEKYSNDDYLFKNTETIVYNLGLGYDYKFFKNYSIGINIRGQLPLVRDKYFFKTGGGYDELIRVGIKLGRAF
jgi:hypothetical protein